MRFESTIDVAAPAERVYEVYADVERWPEWTETVTSVEPLGPGPFEVGARYRIRQPKLPVAEWTVTEIVPGTSFTWMARGPGIVTTGTHVAVPTGTGGSRAVASLEQSGPMGRVVALVYQRLTTRYLDIEVRRLKERCEGAGNGTS